MTTAGQATMSVSGLALTRGVRAKTEETIAVEILMILGETG